MEEGDKLSIPRTVFLQNLILPIVPPLRLFLHDSRFGAFWTSSFGTTRFGAFLELYRLILPTSLV